MAHEGKYQKERLLGSAERVDVFLGLNAAFGRKVAIKELRGGVDTSVTERNAFFAEYEKWAKLEHPRLARIEDIDRTRAWVIQEYLPESIAQLATRFPDDLPLVYQALRQILEGLSYLHSQGMIHCNLKSSNIRVAGDSLKLCDGRCISIGFPGSLPKPRGSNRYLAPEMINEEFGPVGTASDIYVAGIIMLESLAGPKFETLFKGYVSGTPDTEMGWVRWHNSPEPLDPVHQLLPGIPRALADLIDSMVCKEVRIRYSSADRLLDDLEAAREAIVNHTGAESPANIPEGGLVQAELVRPTGQAEVKPSVPSGGPPKGQSAAPKIKLIDRPSAPVYVRCLSGSLAGSIFPLAMGEILIGDTARCNVKIPVAQYPSVEGREVHLTLGNNGWQITDSHSHPLIVDQKKGFHPMPIRG